MPTIKEITIRCSDGATLGATLFSPSHYKAAVLLGPATGIKRNYYTAFASYLAANHYGVITYNNRGIGDSRMDALKTCKASLQDWGALDMTAVLQKLQEQFPNTHYHLIGHSNGGQLVGLMSNAFDLTSILTVASSSGNLNGMKYPYKIKAFFFLNVFMPLSNLLFGYANNQWLGMGEPLPKKVAHQWSKWCGQKGYLKSDFGKAITQHAYNDLALPCLWVYASDDPIATTPNVTEMIAVFPKMKVTTQLLFPEEYQLKEIGHMKFFSRHNQILWPLAKKWLEQFHEI